MSLIDRIQNINIFKSRIVYGVEVNVDAEPIYKFVEVKNYYGKVSIKRTSDTSLNISELTNLISKNVNIPFSANKPISLVVTGKPVVLRKLPQENFEIEDAILLQKTLPGAKLSDFFLQKNLTENQLYVSVIKRSKLEEIIQQLSAEGFNIVNCSLGPFDSLVFKDNFGNDSVFEVSGYEISNDLSSVKYNGVSSIRKFTIGDLKISYDLVVSFASAVTTSQWKYETVNLPQSIKKHIEELDYWNYIIASLRFSIVVIAFLIGTSYFLNKNYEKSLIALQEATSEQNNSYHLFEIKQAEYNSKISILSSTGVNTSKKIAKISDQIGMSLPENISLSEIVIYPLPKKIRKDKKIDFNKGIAIVKGVSSESQNLNFWLKELNTKDWVSEVTIVNYSQTDKQNPGMFELEINVNE